MTMIANLLSILTATSITTVPIALLVANDEGKVFTVAIVDQKRQDSVNNRTLNIVCSSGCRSEISLTETFDDEPLGIFRLSDSNKILYVTSSSGSSYQLRAYIFTDGNISRLLRVSSLSAPVIITKNGFEMVTITKRLLETSQKTVRKLFVWRGGIFKEM